jgi:protein-disulfide isomerase
VKINPETRILLILGLVVLLGGGGMALLNRTPLSAPVPPPTPIQLDWTPQTFASLLSQSRHVRGDSKDARFTIIEFGDLQCPGCRGAYNAYLTKRDKEFPIRFAFFHFPLKMHAQAIPAATATEAAGRQGKFWPMFDALYTGLESPLTEVEFDKSAKTIGLDMKRFAADCKDPALLKLITGDETKGNDARVTQTPTFLLRDEKSGQVYEKVGGIELDKKIAELTHTAPLPPPAPATP